MKQVGDPVASKSGRKLQRKERPAPSLVPVEQEVHPADLEPSPEELAAVSSRDDEQVSHSVRPRREPKQASYLPDIHRTLPQSLDAEKGVLCSCLLSPQNVLSECSNRGITTGHFYQPAHQIIYGEMLDIVENSDVPLEFISLTQRLKDKGQLDKAGGAASISELFTFVPTSSNADYYIDIVREKFLLRQAIAKATHVIDRAYNEQGEVKLLLNEAEALFTELGQEKGGEAAQQRLFGDLDIRRFDPIYPPPPAVPIFKISEHTISTPGNLTVIAAQAKAGKSALIGAFLASTMGSDGDLLGVTSSNDDGKAVLHFDTEQSPSDHHALLMLAMKRAGLKDVPPWLRSYRIADVSMRDRFELVRLELQRAKVAHRAIHSLILDGGADFIADPNDSKEAFAFVESLHRLAIEYSTVILVILHFNPGSEFNKTRGHLGSQLERKAETNLALEKDDSGITTVYSKLARHAHIPKESGSRFQYCDEAGMHISCASTRTTAVDERAQFIVGDLFANGKSMRYGDAIEGIKRIAKVKQRQAETIFTAMSKANLIRKNLASFWEALP